MSEYYSPQFFATAALALGFLVAVGAYGIRIRMRGKVRFDRVDRQESSLLLGRPLMEMVYWSVQPFARSLIRLKVTPNQLSWASLALGMVSALQLAFGHFGTGACVAAASSVLDLLDGLVARATGKASNSGEILDATVDRYNELLFIGALAWYYRWSPGALALALAALGGSFMVSYSTARAEGFGLRIAPGGARSLMRRPERAGYLVLGAALSPVSISWFEPLTPNHPAAAWPTLLALALVAVAGNLSAVARLHWIARNAPGAHP